MVDSVGCGSSVFFSNVILLAVVFILSFFARGIIFYHVARRESSDEEIDKWFVAKLAEQISALCDTGGL
jgi:hypothetical protein